MRFVEIAILLFLLQVSFAIVNATGIYDTQLQPQNDWINDVDDQELANSSYVQSQVSSSTTDTFGDFVRGLYYFVKALGWAIISVPYTLGQLGMIAPYTYYLSAPVYFLYFLAIAQFIRGQDVEKK